MTTLLERSEADTPSWGEVRNTEQNTELTNVARATEVHSSSARRMKGWIAVPQSSGAHPIHANISGYSPASPVSESTTDIMYHDVSSVASNWMIATVQSGFADFAQMTGSYQEALYIPEEQIRLFIDDNLGRAFLRAAELPRQRGYASIKIGDTEHFAGYFEIFIRDLIPLPIRKVAEFCDVLYARLRVLVFMGKSFSGAWGNLYLEQAALSIRIGGDRAVMAPRGRETMITEFE